MKWVKLALKFCWRNQTAKRKASSGALISKTVSMVISSMVLDMNERMATNSFRTKIIIVPFAMLIGTAAAATSLGSAANPSQFDLECAVTSVSGPSGLQRGDTFKIQIDLSSRKYREQEGRIIRIARVTEDEIVLDDEQWSPGSVLTVVDRHSGKYSSDVAWPNGHATHLRAQCERTAFSGFPSKKF